MLERGQIVLHEGACSHCGIVGRTPIAFMLLLRRQLSWSCPYCWQPNVQRLSRNNAKRLKAMFHRVGGTRISPEELAAFQSGLRRVEAAVVREIL